MCSVGALMWEQLTPRETQVAELLLQGCDNQEIAMQLHIARRSVKAHFNKMFVRFQIRDGIKRVKLAVMLYRERRDHESSAAAAAGTSGGA
jgi:DNA-binding NarL/FixJ family response regulator